MTHKIQTVVNRAVMLDESSARMLRIHPQVANGAGLAPVVLYPSRRIRVDEHLLDPC